MYEGYYGLRERPFNLTPDPKYLYLSEKHKEAFAHLLFGIKNRSGFVMVTGEIGTGKTTICRTLLGQLDENTEVAFIFNPYLSPEELLRKINEDFGIVTVATTVRGLIDELNTYLLERNAKGKNCVLVIDEAQNLTPAVLEQIRLLSNLETETQKLLQIVLIGQPELMQVLALHELRQLNQRITARYHLHALSRNETMQYVAYRMRVAGARRRIYFTPAAIKRIYKISNGTPRVINALCDRALLIGYTKEARDITPAIVRQAAKEIRGEQPRKRIWPQVKQWLPNPTVITAGAAILLLAIFLRDRNIFDPAPAAPASQQGVGAVVQTSPAGSRDVAFAEKVPVEKPVQVTAPLAQAQSEATFAGLIDSQDPTASRNAAVQSMLRAWNLVLLSNLPADDSVAAMTKFAEENRLACEVMSVSLEQLEAINLPALIKLHGNSRSIWAALIGAQGDDLKVTTGSSEAVFVPRDRIAESYLNEALVLWRDDAPDSQTLREGMSSDDVRILQVQLRALGRLERAPTGEFDAATAKAIRKIQEETGQKADGAAGRRTRMVLSSWLPGYRTPGLRAMPSVLLNDAGSDDSQKQPEAVEPAPTQEAKNASEAKAVPGKKTETPPKTAKKIETPAPKPSEKEVVQPDATVPAENAPAPTPAEAAPAPPAEAPAPPVPPQINSEELPKPGDAAPAAPAESIPSVPMTPAAQEPAPAPADEAPAWTGGLPLVPADESAGGVSP